MLSKLILCLLTINTLMKTTSSQYYANQYYDNMPQQFYQEQTEPQDMDYEDMGHDHEHTRRSGRYLKYGSSGGRLPRMNDDYDDSEECKCSCNRCKDTYRPPKPCCKEVCITCSGQEPQGQGSLVFVPYPYPLMVPGLIRNETEIKTTTTTTEAAPVIISESHNHLKLFDNNSDSKVKLSSYMKSDRKSSAEIINDFLLRNQNFKGDKKYMLTTMRKTKPTWEPKYGIVPIPDNLAEKLMSQLRQIEKIQTVILIIRSCKTQFLQDISYDHPAQREHYTEIHSDDYHYEINGPSDYRRYNYNSDEASCKCSCQKCDYEPKRCCRRICKRCREQSQKQAAIFYQAPPSLFMMPMPYAMPFLVPPNKKGNLSMTTTTTKKTAESTTAENEASIVIIKRSTTPVHMDGDRIHRVLFTSSTMFPENIEQNKQDMKLNQIEDIRYKYGKIHRKLEMYQKMRPTVKTTDTNLRVAPTSRLPKYGLVAIPSDIAEKLMLQLSNT